MAMAKEIMCCLVIDGSSFAPTSTPLLYHNVHRKNNLLVKKQLNIQRAFKGPLIVAASNEDKTKPSSKADQNPVKAETYTLRAVVTVRNKLKEDLKETLVKQVDALTDTMGRKVFLQLISTEVDPKKNSPKKSKEAVLSNWSNKSNVKGQSVNYTAYFTVDSDFGVPGAILVSNKHQKEFYLENITVEGFPCGPVHFPCNSVVQSSNDLPYKRIFFFNKPYLPSDTPAGLRALREQELKNLRGDGKGVRKLSDRIYDYDVYNDLGNPDLGIDFVRPTLGGEKFPYPRRCRTGRLPNKSDVTTESRVEKPEPMYVPRDEQFEEPKKLTFLSGRRKAVLRILLPTLKVLISKDNDSFSSFSDIDFLYRDGVLLKAGVQDEILRNLPLTSKMYQKVQESGDGVFKFDTPLVVASDKFAWLRDDEFARETLTGINPLSIERLKVFPPKSNLDPEIYGPLESALKEEHIISHLNGLSVQQALDENKLYIIDYHDTYLPFLDGINALDGRKAYATRTIFFLTPLGTLKPIAIELSLPPTGPSSRAIRVVTPPVNSTTSWIWQLAKAHVCANDASVHQLVHHWLKTHATLEPFILAAHRQLSALHPIYKLLDPHMRYTLEINAFARQSLISNNGIVESCFTPGRYAMQISSAAYRSWRFDKLGLHSDLIRRGIAVPDSTQPYGLRLLLEDYPYAQDGLMIWSALEKWIRSYVYHYYPDSGCITNDFELQNWYNEAVNVGHADHRHAEWWPKMTNADSLVTVLTIVLWLGSAQHAALNYAQYPYGGYVPNRPCLMRRLIPEENDPEYGRFIADPQKYFLSALPSLLQAAKTLAIIDTLSTHSPDEEYLGQHPHPSTWTSDPVILKAFDEFSAEIGLIEKEIERRNTDPNLRNRCGAGVIPYELLAPSSRPGMTCRGVPNSITI